MSSVSQEERGWGREKEKRAHRREGETEGKREGGTKQNRGTEGGREGGRRGEECSCIKKVDFLIGEIGEGITLY